MRVRDFKSFYYDACALWLQGTVGCLCDFFSDVKAVCVCYIIEIENIVRHMRMGKTAYQASIDAADEIGLPVVATSFCIVAVFFPVALMPGIIGQFFKNFGLTVVVAVLMSLAVARMITPMLAAYFLRAKRRCMSW